jgi:hypothetical protein
MQNQLQAQRAENVQAGAKKQKVEKDHEKEVKELEQQLEKQLAQLREKYQKSLDQVSSEYDSGAAKQKKLEMILKQ